jgi:multiple sugar transport system ATP-binding protein
VTEAGTTPAAQPPPAQPMPAQPPSVQPAAAVGIRLERVSKRFRGGVVAVSDLDLDVAPGEFLVLVGPSGCGKSTVLRMIAGLEEVSSGHVHIGDQDVTDHLPQERDVAMVFQSYALYPRMTVRQNMAFGLRMRGAQRVERDRRVAEVADVLGLEPLLDRRPAALSGGQRQRVAMGRAIVREPKAFLMDEPLSNLDAKLRVSMRSQLSLLHQRLGTTTVYVTHDQIEAMTLGQRVAVLRDGTLQQCDTPQVLFRNPVNLFVAAFIGSPSMNFVQATVSRGAARFADVELPVNGGPPDGDVVLGIRPTAFGAGGPDGGRDGGRDRWPTLRIIPEVVEDLGDERYVIFELEAPRVDTDAVRAALDARSPDEVSLFADARARFTARLPADAPVTIGEPLTVSVDASRLYFFDPATGAALGGGGHHAGVGHHH